jgi:hypothetical protein
MAMSGGDARGGTGHSSGADHGSVHSTERVQEVVGEAESESILPSTSARKP